MFVAITSDDGWSAPQGSQEGKADAGHGLESPRLQWLSMPARLETCQTTEQHAVQADWSGNTVRTQPSANPNGAVIESACRPWLETGVRSDASF